MIQLADVYYPMYLDKDKMIILVTGGRGCETPTQEIMMADLTVKMIKDIRVGERVMGDDFTPRTVIGTMQGRGMMYRVQQSDGEDYFVNTNHILTVSDGKYVDDVNVIDFMKNRYAWRNYKGLRVQKTAEGRKAFYSDLTITPHGKGEWCGISRDGNQRYLHADGTVTHNSGKSFATGAFIERLTFEAFPKPDNPDEKITHTILYTRYTMVSANISVIPEMMEKIELDGVSKYFSSSRGDVRNILTGAKIMFRGIHTSSGNQTAKLKSIHGITTFVVDEAEEWTSEAEFDKIMLSIRQKGIKNRIIIIMNPTDSNHFVYRRFIKDTHKVVDFDGVPVQISTHPNVLHIHTTYLDNIKNLSEDFIKETERIKAENPEKYAHTVMGQWADVAEGAVFKNWGIVDKFPDYAKKIALGVDFGYSNDQTAIVKCGIIDNRLYIQELCYKTHMLVADIIEELKPYKGMTVICDSADPRLIQEIFNAGILIYPVIKGGGSILAGIEKMKDMEMFVTRDSLNLQHELRNYVWDRDKNGNYINKPVDKDNHCFVGETLVITKRGAVRFDRLKLSDKVLTVGGYRRITRFFDQGTKKVVTVRLVFGGSYVELTATPDHKVRTLRGWVELEKLKVGDVVFVFESGKTRGIFRQTLTAIEYRAYAMRQVYDIEVEERHEFFANGVLVHNCIDASRYYVLGQILGQITKPVKYNSDGLGIF